MSEIEKQIFVKGEKHEFSSNHKLSLHEKGALWFLSKGSVNLFAIKGKEGKRTLITTITSPSPLFAFPKDNENYEIFAITEQDSQIWKVSIKEIESYLDQDRSYMNAWINQLATFHKKEICTETNLFLIAPDKARLAAGETLSLKRAITHEEKKKINWITIEKGELNFLGHPSVRLPKGPFPLTYDAWLKSSSQTLVHAADSVEDWKKGLYLYHQLLIDYLHARVELDSKEQKIQAEQRKEREDELVDESLRDIVSVLNPMRKAEKISDSGARTLFKACQAIGDFLTTPFHMPQDIQQLQDIEQLISKITETSEVRYRQVSLKGKWWKKDSGALLGFFGPQKKPVALIPKRSGYYDMFDPETNSRHRVKKENAKELSLTGYYFYSSLPKEIKSGKEIIHFFLKHNRKEFFPLVFYGIIAAILALFPPYATEKLINLVIPDANYSLLWQLSISLFIAALASSAFLYFRSLLGARLEGRSSEQLALALWDRLLKLPVSFFRRYSTGNLILRVMSTEWMRSLISGKTIRALFSGLFSIFYLIAMFFYAPTLTFIAIGFIVLSFFITLICAYFYGKLQQAYYAIDADTNAFIVQIISSVGKLRTAGAEKNAFSKWSHLFAQFKKVDLHAQNIRSLITTMNYILPFIMYLAIFSHVMWSGEKYSLGAYLAFNTAFITFYIAMTDLSNTVLEMTPVIPLWNRCKVIIKEPLEEQVKAHHPGTLKGEIHIDEVSFKYEDSETPLLKRIVLKANPKELIGIVGPSGCGKSTLIRLLLGFERPNSGAIFYDGKDLASFTLQDFRKQLGVVLQEEGIISGSIYNNLVCGGTYKPEDIERALEISGFVEDVASFPMGLHTYLPMGGTTLSGGQRQRLLIARAILPKPKILLLDEATSALDNRNQEKVIKSIDQLDVTRIVIAHRLSTIKNADRIYVMQQGEIVQNGSYEELASQTGLFKEILDRQSL